MPKPVAVILVNWNTPDYTTDCINALNKYCNAANFDIILVDNGSADDSVAVLQARFPALTFIDNKENLGFAEGHNRGMQYSIDQGYAYSLVMNTDTLVDEDMISPLLAHLSAHPEAAAVQPAIYWMHNRAKLWNGPCYFNTFTGKAYAKTETYINKETAYRKVDWVTGCCILFRNDALKKSGLFNKQFFFYYEDVELSHRLRGDGHQLHYLPTTKMYHEAGVTGRSASAQKEGFLNPFIHYLIARNNIWFLRRYGKPAFFPVYFLYNGFYYGAVWAYFLLKGKNKKRASLIKGIKEGLNTPQSTIWPTN